MLLPVHYCILGGKERMCHSVSKLCSKESLTVMMGKTVPLAEVQEVQVEALGGGVADGLQTPKE